MAHVVELDRLYPEMEEATIGRWLVVAGETVAEGQPLAELITDKVAYEYQSPATGTLLAVLVPEKSVVPVGASLAVVGAADETVEGLEELLERNRRLTDARETALRTLQQATAGVAPDDTAPRAGAVRATPAARRLARERGIDLATVQGSGPGGMVTVEDLG